MPFPKVSSSRSEHLKKARAALKSARESDESASFTTNPRSAPYGIDPASPLLEVKEGPRNRIKKRLFESEEHLRDYSKRPRPNSSEILPEPKPILPEPEKLLELERKWHAVLEFQEFKILGICTNELANAIGEKYGVGNGRNVRFLAEKVEERGSLLRKEGSGRPLSLRR